MNSCSTPLSIQRLLSSLCTARVITTVILVVALSGILSACIRVHIALAPNGTAVPRDTQPEHVPDEKSLNRSATIQGTTPQCDLKSQVPNAQQQTGSWCWAASSQLVVEYLTKKPASQCGLVTQTFEKALRDFTDKPIGPFPDCCGYLTRDPSASNLGEICERGGWPENILNNVREITFQKQTNNLPMGQGLDWAGLTKQICDDHPFIFVVRWRGGGRHSAVGGGYRKTTRFGNFVEVYDHSPDGFYVMPYAEFNENQGNFTHEFDYFDIQKVQQ